MTEEQTERATDSGLRTIITIAGGMLAVQAMLLVTGIISARLLGVEGRGQIAMVAAVSVLLARLTMAGSLPVAISHALSSGRQTARDGLRPFLARWAGWALAPSAIAGGYLGWLLRDQSSLIQWGLACAAAAQTYLTIWTGIAGSSIQGELASARTVVLGSVRLQVPLFLLLSAAALLGWIDGPVTVAAIMIVGGVLGLAWAGRLLLPARHEPSTISGPQLRRSTADNYLASLGTLSGIGIDRNLVGAWLGTAALGLYSAATAFATLSTIVGNAISSLLLPRLSAAGEDPDEQAKLVRTWLPITAGLIACLVGCLELVVQPVIRIAFGTAFLPAVETARWLLLADGLMGFRRVLTAVLQARSRGRLASIIELVLTGLLVGGIAVAALRGDLALVGVVLACVGAASCLCLAVAIRLTAPHGAARA